MCTFLDTPFLQIISETKLVHYIFFHPCRPYTYSPCCTTWTKQRFVSCYKTECMQLYLFLMLTGLCYLDSNWNTNIHFNLLSRCSSWSSCWSSTWCDSCGGLCWNNIEYEWMNKWIMHDEWMTKNAIQLVLEICYTTRQQSTSTSQQTACLLVSEEWRQKLAKHMHL